MFASHGMMHFGSQVVLTNRFYQSPRERNVAVGFYEYIEVEKTLRYFAKQMPRVYFIVLFACCREHFGGKNGKGALVESAYVKRFKLQALCRESNPRIQAIEEGLTGAANMTMLFGCEPTYGVEADTKFVQEFVTLLASSFDQRTGSLIFPNCLSQLEQRKVRFESVTDNLGRAVCIKRQDSRIDFKTLIVFETHQANQGLNFAVDRF